MLSIDHDSEEAKMESLVGINKLFSVRMPSTVMKARPVIRTHCNVKPCVWSHVHSLVETVYANHMIAAHHIVVGLGFAVKERILSVLDF